MFMNRIKPRRKDILKNCLYNMQEMIFRTFNKDFLAYILITILIFILTLIVALLINQTIGGLG